MFATGKDHAMFTKEGRRPLIRKEILESWERCLAGGLRPEQMLPPPAPGIRQITVSDAAQPFSIIKAAMDKMSKASTQSPSEWLICNPDGEIMEIFSSNQIFRDKLKNIGIQAGVNLSEKYSGTNAVSLAMNGGMVPSLCAWPEHYMTAFHFINASAAPFYDIDGSLKGYAAVFSSTHDSDIFMLRTMLLMLIQMLDKEMRANRFKNLYKGVKSQFSRLFNDNLRPIVMLNRNGYIRHINPAAMSFFGLNESNIREMALDKIVSFNPPFKEEALSAIAVQNEPTEIKTPSRLYKVTYEKIPLFSENDEFLGAIFIFYEKSKQLKQNPNAMSEAKYTFNDIIGKTRALQMAKELAVKAAPTSVNILLIGGSGTGKEVFAQSIHNASTRKDFPFVAINCAAIPREIAESELFGYSSGAFTGANRTGKTGKLEAADKGTVFLDEIGDMPFELQSKLLRMLEERTITRVGSNKEIPVDIRIIAATNRNIPDLITNGLFREDLYYRINVSTIKLPALAESIEDIPELAQNFIEYFNESMGKKVKGIEAGLLEKLKAYSWPGNIRELRNAMEFAVMLNSGQDLITLKELPGQLRMALLYKDAPEIQNPDPLQQERLAMENGEKALYIKAIKFTEGNLSEAAKILKIGRSTLYRKIQKLDLKV